MTGVVMKRGEFGNRGRHSAKCHVKMEAKIGVILL